MINTPPFHERTRSIESATQSLSTPKPKQAFGDLQDLSPRELVFDTPEGKDEDFESPEKPVEGESDYINRSRSILTELANFQLCSEQW